MHRSFFTSDSLTEEKLFTTLDGDGIDEIITGPGPGPTHAPRVRGFNYDGEEIGPLAGVDFQAFDAQTFTHGVKVGGLRN